MSNKPNFVYQVQKTEQNLQSEWTSVQEVWTDCVAESFREKIMEPYMSKYQQYITGEGFHGYGLERLLHQMEEHLKDMDLLIE
jgi:hypothetical protein